MLASNIMKKYQVDPTQAYSKGYMVMVLKLMSRNSNMINIEHNVMVDVKKGQYGQCWTCCYDIVIDGKRINMVIEKLLMLMYSY
jgi:hypothetical protein